jgi:hypothetical protein
MKWFDKWFAKKCKQAWENARNEPDSPASISSAKLVREADGFETDAGLRMELHQAIGGRIVSFRHYDRKTDRSYSKVYVIHDELDFERELGKIITQESMR